VQRGPEEGQAESQTNGLCTFSSAENTGNLEPEAMPDSQSHPSFFILDGCLMRRELGKLS